LELTTWLAALQKPAVTDTLTQSEKFPGTALTGRRQSKCEFDAIMYTSEVKLKINE